MEQYRVQDNICKVRRHGGRLILMALLMFIPVSMSLGGCSEELFTHHDNSAREKARYFPDPHPIENYNRYGQPSNSPQNFSGGGGF